jgi:hypothetical protein
MPLVKAQLLSKTAAYVFRLSAHGRVKLALSGKDHLKFVNQSAQIVIIQPIKLRPFGTDHFGTNCNRLSSPTERGPCQPDATGMVNIAVFPVSRDANETADERPTSPASHSIIYKVADLARPCRKAQDINLQHRL